MFCSLFPVVMNTIDPGHGICSTTPRQSEGWTRKGHCDKNRGETNILKARTTPWINTMDDKAWSKGGDKVQQEDDQNICDPFRDISHFQDLFLVSPIGIFVIQNKRFKFVNPAFVRISGYTEEEILSMAPLEIVVPEDREMVRQNAIQMLKGIRTTPYVHKVIDKYGQLKWIIESVTSVCYEGKRATLGYFMDNTKHEMAKQALALSEEKFNKAFLSSPDWFVISTWEDGFYLDVNDAFLRASGYSRDEIIGRSSVELGIWVNPAQREEALEIIQKDGRVRNMEVQFKMKSGEVRWMLWSAEPIEYQGEKCILAIARDITELKKAEQERLEKERIQVLLETAGATCHQLNQPLQFLFYLVSELEDSPPTKETIMKLKEQCHRLKEITSKLENITTYKTIDYVGGERIVDIDKALKK